MTTLRAILICTIALGVSPVTAIAQSAAAPKAPKIQASTLLNSGFQIVATNYLSQSIVVTLQRGNRAFLCELRFDGTTIQCVEVK